MFIKKIDTSDSFYASNIDVVNPSSINYIEYTVPPFAKNGFQSGSYLMAQYFMSQYFCQKDYKTDLTDDIIMQIFYNDLTKTDGYISFEDGINAVANYLRECTGDQKCNVIFFNDIELIKHFIHKFCTIVVELETNLAFCNTIDHDMNGVFECPSLSSKNLNDALTKGFIACGYDSQYIILQNSLGQKFGSAGFMKMKWNDFSQVLVKAGCIKNTY